MLINTSSLIYCACINLHEDSAKIAGSLTIKPDNAAEAARWRNKLTKATRTVKAIH